MKRIVQKPKLNNLIVIAIAALLVAFTLGYPFKGSWESLGVGEDSNKLESVETTIKDGKTFRITTQFQSAKTLWDLLGLLGTIAIPVMLFQLQIGEQRRAEERARFEQKQAEEKAEVEKYISAADLREEALQGYIDRMSELLINENSRHELLFGEKPDEKTNSSNQKKLTKKDVNTYIDNSVRDVARIRTITILRRLENDVLRQNIILNFLRDAKLLNFLLRTANLCKVNLSGTDLSNADLSGARLNGANLSSINLSNTNLYGADFTDANLSGANLENCWMQDTTFVNSDLSNTRLVYAKTWNEIEIHDNFEFRHIEGDDYSHPYTDERWYKTDFSGAKLTDANLISTNFKGANNLTSEQLKNAKNWDEAIYDSDLFKMLGLPESLQSVIDSMVKNADEDEDEDVIYQKLIGCQIEVRNYTDNETKTVTKGELTGFNKSKSRVKVKTSNGELWDKLFRNMIYVYTNSLPSNSTDK
jgi:uncharacterized protein YjbI with pentapeptide repeats